MESLAGGINGQVWLVRTAAGRFIAKASHRSQLVAGLEVAEVLEAAGFRAGAPLRTMSGEIAVPLGDQRALALLHFVSGRPLDLSRSEDRARIGATLGAVHSILLASDTPSTLARWPWPWLMDFDKTHLSSDLKVAIATAVRTAEGRAAEHHLTQGIVHGDVSGRDFLFDELTGAVGLVDWGAAMYGPLLYDLASFVALARLVGTDRESFIASYSSQRSLPEGERSALDAFIALRWAVQVRYFSWRIANNVRTGFADDQENERGLRDGLEALGL
jgi:Ser/Thr protein kinase RdoA (MazF antagonist)